MFSTVVEAYNAYKGLPVESIESRAQAINAELAANPQADVAGYATELEALTRIIEEKQRKPETRAQASAIVEHTAAAATAADDDPAGTAEYRSAFFKKLQGRALTSAEKAAFDAVNAERRSGDEFNDTDNAQAIIPTQTLAEIVVKARDHGGILSACRAFSVPANVSIPVATPGANASWHVEGEAVETEKASVANVRFGAYEILRVLSLSAATREMSVTAFEAYLAEELRASVLETLAKGIVDGTGEDQALGILTGVTWDESNTVEVAENERIGYADILSAIAKLPRGYSKGASFAVNNATLYQDIYGMVDEVNRPIYVQDVAKPGSGTILGFPVIIDDYLDDHDVLFGNFKFAGYNLPSGITLDMSRDAKFTSGLTCFRALAVADARPIVTEAFTKITTAAESVVDEG